MTYLAEIQVTCKPSNRIESCKAISVTLRGNTDISIGITQRNWVELAMHEQFQTESQKLPQFLLKQLFLAREQVRIHCYLLADTL